MFYLNANTMLLLKLLNMKNIDEIVRSIHSYSTTSYIVVNYQERAIIYIVYLVEYKHDFPKI